MKGKNKTTLMNDILNKLMMKSNFPEWNEETQHWHTSEMRHMNVFVKSSEGAKIPIKWAFFKIFGQFDIEPKYLQTHQIEEIFQSFGLETGSYGRGDE